MSKAIQNNPLTLYPAIDLKDGLCVRLKRGVMEDATIFHDTPAEQAKLFQDAGCEWLHVVDLDGAFTGKNVNSYAVRAIRARVEMHVQLGGGIRSFDAVEHWIKAGVSRVVLGTAALKNPELVKSSAKHFPGQIAVGIDVNKGKVAVEGWAEKSNIAALDLARRFEDAGVAAIIYTDISRDGMMKGANVEETARLAEQITIPVIVSGGIASLADIAAVKKQAHRGISGVIVGRALYEGAFSPKDALKLLAA